MPNVKDCPGFETFGADVQQAREAVENVPPGAGRKGRY